MCLSPLLLFPLLVQAYVYLFFPYNRRLVTLDEPSVHGQLSFPSLRLSRTVIAPGAMMNTLPPSPASSPRPDGYVPRQKDDAIEFLHSSALHLSHPPSPQASSDRDDPSSPTSRDFTPRVDGNDDGVFKGTPPCSDPTSPDVAAAAHPHKNYRPSKPRLFSEKRSFPRISRPVELMRNSYDYVVIGSGYGGAVAASRLARSVGPEGRNSVCVLERGMERWPGEYPSSAMEGLKNLHVSGEFAPGETKGTPVDKGDPEGMYRLILGKGLSAVVGSGKCNACPGGGRVLTDKGSGARA